jgi:FtsP/CotA-like multicopper oxidase with cupredoxin domain
MVLDATAAARRHHLQSSRSNGVNGTPPICALVQIEANRDALFSYRFRLVSISCDPNYVFQIDGHDMTIIEVDSIATRPLKVDQIHIFAGQRYSFILTANQKVDNYCMFPSASAATLWLAC